MRIIRPITAVTESFSDNPSNNLQELQKIKTLPELREKLRQIPYFDKPDTVGYSWIAVPYSDDSYFIAIYAIDENTDVVYRVDTGLAHFTNGGSVDEDVVNVLDMHNISADYLRDTSYELTDNDLRYYFPLFIKDAVSFFETDSTHSPSANKPTFNPHDVREHVRNKGGEITVQTPKGEMTGIPVIIEYDYTAGYNRARANDGVHGLANVAFPKDARQTDAIFIIPRQYITWSNKFYRVDGRNIFVDSYRVN